MTTKELIYSALRAIGVISNAETPSADMVIDAQAALNMLIEAFSAERLIPNVWTSETQNLITSQGVYTIALSQSPAADFNSLRPIRIESAYVTVTGVDYSVLMMSRDRYNEIADKTVTGIPNSLYYSPEYPKGKIYLYPEPAGAYVLHMDSWKPMADLTVLTDTISMPGEYLRALKWNLASELGSEFGRPPDALIEKKAEESIRILKRLHSYPVKEVKHELAVRQTYDINNA